MSALKKILNQGISKEMDLETKKRVKVINLINSFSILICIASIIAFLLFDLPKTGLLFITMLSIVMCIPILLINKGYHLVARLFYLIVAYILLTLLPIIFGPELHYQYFMVAGVGMPLIFLNNEIGWKKWILVFLALPLWLYLEWHFTKFDALIKLDKSILESLRIFNDFLLFSNVIFMFYIFTAQNQNQIKIINKQKKNLEKLNKNLDSFAYIASHDLKAPLRGISSVVQIIEEDYADQFDDDFKELLNLISKRTIRLQDLIASILEYSRSGQQIGDLSNVDLNETVNEIIDSIAPPQSFNFEIPKKLPSIQTSYTQISQVLTNLIGNAVKYHNKEDGIVKILCTSINKDWVKFEIIDDGLGIPEEYHNKVFGIFETANNESRMDSTGVGLAIVKKLVELYGGKIGLVSEKGKGCNFWFTWPTSIKEED